MKSGKESTNNNQGSSRGESTSNSYSNLGFETKTRIIKKIQVLEREDERKKYRMGELDEIYGQFLARSFDFPNFGAIWRERELSLSLFLSFGRATHKRKRRGKEKGWREKGILQNSP